MFWAFKLEDYDQPLDNGVAKPGWLFFRGENDEKARDFEVSKLRQAHFEVRLKRL